MGRAGPQPPARRHPEAGGVLGRPGRPDPPPHRPGGRERPAPCGQRVRTARHGPGLRRHAGRARRRLPQLHPPEPAGRLRVHERLPGQMARHPRPLRPLPVDPHLHPPPPAVRRGGHPHHRTPVGLFGLLAAGHRRLAGHDRRTPRRRTRPRLHRAPPRPRAPRPRPAQALRRTDLPQRHRLRHRPGRPRRRRPRRRPLHRTRPGLRDLPRRRRPRNDRPCRGRRSHGEAVGRQPPPLQGDHRRDRLRRRTRHRPRHVGHPPRRPGPRPRTQPRGAAPPLDDPLEEDAFDVFGSDDLFGFPGGLDPDED